MTNVIAYRILPAFYKLPKRDGEKWTDGDLITEVKSGLIRYKDFFQVEIRPALSTDIYPISITTGVWMWGGTQPWAWWQYWDRTVRFNVALNWRLNQIAKGILHEVGHATVTYNHFTWPDYFTNPNNQWSHVMKLGASTTFQGTFSPREVKYCVDKKLFKLSTRPVHPFCREYAKMDTTGKKANLERLKKIVMEYTKLGVHAIIYKWQKTNG